MAPAAPGLLGARPAGSSTRPQSECAQGGAPKPALPSTSTWPGAASALTRAARLGSAPK
jgi:hypothetical protein